MSYHFDSQDGAGTTIGACLAFGKTLYVQLTVIGNITLPVLLDTAILASVGATVGFLITALLKFIKRKISKK